MFSQSLALPVNNVLFSLTRIGMKMAKQEFATNFPLKHAQKDMRFALQLASQVSLLLKLLSLSWFCRHFHRMDMGILLPQSIILLAIIVSRQSAITIKIIHYRYHLSQVGLELPTTKTANDEYLKVISEVGDDDFAAVHTVDRKIKQVNK